MKKIIVLLLMVMFILSLGGCSDNKSSKKLIVDEQAKKSEKVSSGVSKKRVALIMKTLTNPFFIEMEKGARKAQQEFNIDLIVKTGAKETSIEQQIAIVEEMVSQKVDAIVIAPGSSTELVPALKKAQDAGIPIVNIDNRLDKELSKKLGLIGVPFISVDNEKGAYLSAKYLSDRITKPTKAAIIEGIREADNAEQRKNGALRAFKENPNISIAAMETANWKIDEANEVISRILIKHPDIGAIFCANDMMALGVIQYLDKTGKKDILVAGFDDLEEARKAIKEGKMASTINQQADAQGYTGVKKALDMINGKKPVLEEMIEVKVINKENVN